MSVNDRDVPDIDDSVPEMGEPDPPPAPARSRNSAELHEDAIVRVGRPRRGWRAAVHRLTGGRLSPGARPDESVRRDWLRRVQRPLHGAHLVAVTSIKGGVGKTTVSACLGLTLAEHRGDRAIVLDANPDAGTLADRLTGDTSVTVRDLLENAHNIRSLSDVTRYTSLAGRLQVLASEQDPAMSEAFNRDEYEQVCRILTDYFNILITDSGTGLVHSAMEGTLALADSLVIIGALTVDGAMRASKTLDWLDAHGHGDLVRDAVVVLSLDRRSLDIDPQRVWGHFAARCRAVVEIPFDPHLATGGRIELPRLKRETRDAFLELAAYIADGFGATHRPRR